MPARLDQHALREMVDDRRALMRVAILAPIAWRTPPRQYGPWEQVVATLTDGPIGVGIDVTLYATGDSSTRAGVRSVVRRGYEEDSSYDVKVFEALHIARVFEDADQFDRRRSGR